MTMKYAFLVVTGIAVAIIAAVGFLLPSAGDRAALMAGPGHQAPNAQRVHPGHREMLETVQRRADALERVRKGSELDGSGLLAIAAPPKEETDTELAGDQGDDDGRQPRRPLPERTLSLVLEGRDTLAVVDGALVREGDAVGQGGVVDQIRPGSVVVAERDDRRQRLEIRDTSREAEQAREDHQ